MFMKKPVCFSMLFLFLFFAPSPIASADPSPWRQQPTYGGKAWGKFKYGFTNLCFGWTEFMTKPFEAVQSGSIYDMCMGIPYGLCNGLADTVGGVAHMITAPITSLDIPLPDGGVDFQELKEEKRL